MHALAILAHIYTYKQHFNKIRPVIYLFIYLFIGTIIKMHAFSTIAISSLSDSLHYNFLLDCLH